MKKSLIQIFSNLTHDVLLEVWIGAGHVLDPASSAVGEGGDAHPLPSKSHIALLTLPEMS